VVKNSSSENNCEMVPTMTGIRVYFRFVVCYFHMQYHLGFL